MSVTINIGQASPRPQYMGGIPGFGSPGGMGGYPFPGNISMGPGGEGNCGCKDSKKKKDKKEPGIFKSICKSLFGKDGLLGKLFGDDDDDKKCCKKGRSCKDHSAVGMGSVMIQMNNSFGF